MPTQTYTPIARQVLASAAATVTFSSISSAYTDLVVVFNGGTTSSGPTMRMTVNGDSGANYSDTALDGDGSSAISTRHSSANFMAITNNIGIAGTLGAQTTIMQLQNYSNATTYKTVLFRTNNATSTGYPGVTAAVGLWRNTAAITSISLTTASTTFLSGSTFTLYGIKAGS
jgi:hypothetical protein